MRLFQFIFLTSFFQYTCPAQNFVTISKTIQVHCEISKTKWKGETFHHVRVRLYKIRKLDLITHDFDTLYLMELYDIESGTYVGNRLFFFP
jgi:hypothetical protein